MKCQVLRLRGAVSPIYLTSNPRNGEDGQGVSETLMCNNSNQMDTHTRSSHSLRLASHCGVMRGVMCEGGVGERRTEGLREIESELERKIERCRGSWGGCVWKASDHCKSLFFPLFFGSPLQTDVWVQLRNYVSQARFTQPKQNLITDKKLRWKQKCLNTKLYIR